MLVEIKQNTWINPDHILRVDAAVENGHPVLTIRTLVDVLALKGPGEVGSALKALKIRATEDNVGAL
jgi:hypothetical protein